MDWQLAHSLVLSYVDGWKTNHLEQVLNTLTPDCLIIESHGPSYYGRDLVQSWMSAWFGAGASIQRWDITSFFFADDAAAFEWVFECTGSWGHSSFDGTSIVRFAGDRIHYLREYRSTKMLYPWSA